MNDSVNRRGTIFTVNMGMIRWSLEIFHLQAANIIENKPEKEDMDQ